ncbi:MAG TPA: Calx-beta domain-containing protein [Trichocoleus sp.]|jgi:uncharacterized delta-60 repeat protein
MTTLDSTFGSNGEVTTDFGLGDDNIQSILLQPDGKIVVIGDAFNGISYDFAIARYNSDGSLDATFGAGGKVTTNFGLTSAQDTGLDAVLQADGKILVVGDATIGGDNDIALARYNSDGSLDSSFSSDGLATLDFGGGDDKASSIALQSDGKFLVAGNAYINPDLDFVLARYNSNGSLDGNFGSSGYVTTHFGVDNDAAFDLAVQSDGNILVAGFVDGGTSGLDFGLARYTSSGVLDTSFGNGGTVKTDFALSTDIATSIALQPDGKILVAGEAGISGDSDFALVRYNGNGTLDTSFGNGGKITTDFGFGNDRISSIVLQSDGKILVAGRASIGSASNLDFALARYNSNGTLDTSFGNGGTFTVDFGSGEATAYKVLLQQTGQILVGGQALIGSDRDFALARLAPPPTVQFSQAVPYQAGEGAGTTSVVNLVRNGDTTIASQVQVNISGGTATAGTDYSNTGFPLTISFAAGETSKAVAIPIAQDTLVEGTETLTFSIASLSNATIGATNTATLQVLDDDINPGTGTGQTTDRLIGDASANTLVGNANDNVLSGQGGNDILTGGNGRDQFVFDINAPFNKQVIGIDSITDFTRTVDTIILDRTTFSKFKGTQLRPIDFASVKTISQAKKSKALITYVRSIGALCYNENKAKSGFGAGGQFADLTDGLKLSRLDISIVN